jgi:hypothetical protein
MEKHGLRTPGEPGEAEGDADGTAEQAADA